MSTASSFYDDGLVPGDFEKWRRIIHQEPKILQLQQSMLQRPVNHSYDMPYVAGYNTKGDCIYIDRHLPFIVEIDGKSICIRDLIRLHEATEKSLLMLWEHKYEPTHHIATAVEYSGALDMGLKIESYKKFLRPFIKHDNHEKLVKIPFDLDLTPMKGDDKLLAHLRPLMLADRKTAGRVFAAK